MRTSDLEGLALDWAVAKCEGYTDLHKINGRLPHEPQLAMMPPRKAYGAVELWELGFSTDWGQGGPIIERERISIIRCDDDYQNFPGKWMAERGANSYSESTEHQQHEAMIQFYVWNDGSCFAKDGPFYGPTPLIAAMRCFVASKLGEEVEIPEELS